MSIINFSCHHYLHHHHNHHHHQQLNLTLISHCLLQVNGPVASYLTSGVRTPVVRGHRSAMSTVSTRSMRCSQMPTARLRSGPLHRAAAECPAPMTVRCPSGQFGGSAPRPAGLLEGCRSGPDISPVGGSV